MGDRQENERFAGEGEKGRKLMFSSSPLLRFSY
jgi:hypothetical protein